MNTSDIIIRPVTVADAEALLQIYAPYVTETAITFEYEVPTLSEFRSRIAHTLEQYPYLAAVQKDGRIVGYAYASAFKGRPAYNWSVETSIYIARDCRGQHIGSLLYDALEGILKAQNVSNACACICASYDASILFHENRGYRLVATFHKSGYKDFKWHDMVWMEKVLAPHEIPPKDFIPYSRLLTTS